MATRFIFFFSGEERIREWRGVKERDRSRARVLPLGLTLKTCVIGSFGSFSFFILFSLFCGCFDGQERSLNL